MKYLFFDIECSVVSKKAAKICAFGYCLTDEKFDILEKEDLLINPQGGFHLTDRKGTQGLVLPYEYAGFKNYPTFLQRKEKIYGLLQRRTWRLRYFSGDICASLNSFAERIQLDLARQTSTLS